MGKIGYAKTWVKQEIIFLVKWISKALKNFSNNDFSLDLMLFFVIQLQFCRVITPNSYSLIKSQNSSVSKPLE